jgi:hypothetical protein
VSADLDAAARPTVPGDGAAAAAAAVSDVVEYIFEEYPYIARRAGRHDFDGRLPEVTRRSTARLEQLRATVRGHLTALPDSADAELRADLDTALRLLDHECFRVHALGQVHQGAMDWVYESDVSVYLGSPYAPAAERVAALRAHLAQLPQFLRQAAGTLNTWIPAGERLNGIDRAKGQAAVIGGAVAQLERDHPELVTEQLRAAAVAAAAACEEYARAIEAAGPAKALLGPELLAELLRTCEGIEQPAAELVAEIEAEIESLVSALDAAAAGLGVGDRRAAYDLMAAQFSAGTVLASVRSVIDRLTGFWTEQDVVPVETANPLELRGLGRAGRSTEVVFTIAPPLEQARQPHLLYVPEPPAPAVSGGARGLREYLNDPMLEMLAVHEVFAGHYLQVETALRGPSVIRNSIFWFSGFTEGWAHYAEELAIACGLAQGRPLVEVAQLRFALEAAIRSLVYLRVHLGQWTFAQARDRAGLICHWTPERAAREVLEVASNRNRAMYALGKLQVRRWRRAAGVGESRPELRRFHHRLMRCGSAPLSTVWRYYLDGQRAGGPDAAVSPQPRP